MSQLFICDHPLIQHKVSMLRDKNTGGKEFRELVEEITALICYEATRDLPLVDTEIETPIAIAKCKQVPSKLTIVPLLRAGIEMAEGMLNLLPTAKVGHIGLYRDPHTLTPVEYYCKLPSDCMESEIFVVDPMLATGGTAAAAIGFLKDRGARKIKFLCVVSCPDGVEKLKQEHPDVDIYTAAYDESLNSHGYIVPGLGDAGDRLFGTK